MAPRIPRFERLITADDNKRLDKRSNAIAFAQEKPPQPHYRPLYGFNITKEAREHRLKQPIEEAVKACHRARLRTAVHGDKHKRKQVPVTLPTIKGLSED